MEHGHHYQQFRRRAHLRTDHPADEGPHSAGRSARGGGPSLDAAAGKDLRISVITTKRAYEELEREGFLTTVPGKGCFVAARDLELVREETLRRVEEHLSQAVDLAKGGGVTLEELEQTLTILYGDE